MGFEEKFEQDAETTMDKINAFVSDPDAINKALDKFDNAISTKIVEGMESAEGNYYAAQEMAKMAADRGESIVNSALIQAQMRMEDAKEKIDEKLDEMKEDADKADKE